MHHHSTQLNSLSSSSIADSQQSYKAIRLDAQSVEVSLGDES